MSIIPLTKSRGKRMEKIYGYKSEDVIALAQYLKEKKGRSLSSVFESFAHSKGKAKGTIRNLYYALAKKSVEDKEFCKKYFDGIPLKVSRGENFKADEEKELIKKVMIGTKDGRSVRSIIIELAKGDAKLALRYQNKFRNAVKNKPDLIKEVISQEIKNGQSLDLTAKRQPIFSVVNENQVKRLKGEIDNLISKISASLKRENERLKARLTLLETENKRLISLLYQRQPADAKNFFKIQTQKEFIN